MATVTITYSITSGQLPITVLLKDGGSTVATNIHNSYGQYTFDEVPEAEYVIEFYELSTYLCGSEVVSPCYECYEGYTPVGDKCIGYTEEAPIYSAPTYTVIKKAANAAYSVYGAIIFNSGWNYNGTGIYERILPTTNTYWHNTPYPSMTGVMNRTCVWASVTHNMQDIGFSFCVDIAIAKSYYIGFGCDNWGKIKLNGIYILEQNRTAIKTMFGSSDNGVLHKYWFIYPVDLPEGRNVIEVLATNEYLVAAAGIQIYDATKEDLMAATNANPLGSKILFTSESLVGQALNYEYSPSGGYHGYRCPDGFSLDDCDGTPKCIQRVELECGEVPPTTTTTSTSTTSTSTTTTTTTLPPPDCNLDGSAIEYSYFVKMSVSNPNYDYLTEQNIPYLIGSSSLQTYVKSGYNYLFLSVPADKTFIVKDSMGTDITSLFTFVSNDIRFGYFSNKIYKKTQIFNSNAPVPFTLILS